ncbi:hypothetical protein [Streptomyces sp. CAU 1734]|uniref:hypothetical protein n=1 Tax=Streptomyces sp. CAU 1734 TaxID=3140360 RepID=UPI0032619389
MSEGEDDSRGVPGPVSREAYPVIREGPANARSHGRASPVLLPIVPREGRRDDRGNGRRGAFRAPDGRAALFGGRADAGLVSTAPGEAVWRLPVRWSLEDRSGG